MAKKRNRRFTNASAARATRAQLVARSQGRVAIPACTHKYLSASIDPVGSWDDIDEVCVPDSTVLPSTKRKYRYRGTFEAGTTGWGYIMLNPYAPANNNVLIRTTTSTSVMTNATNFNAVTNQGAINGPFEWANTDFVNYRIVGAGLRVVYEGTKLDQGGMFMTYKDPSNADVYNNIDIDILAARPEFEQTRITDRAAEVVWLPVAADDFSYVESTGSATPTPLWIGVKTATGSTQPFMYEVVLYYELIGGTIRQGRTPSHSDPVGFGKAQQALQNPNEYMHLPSHARKRSVFEKFAGIVGDVTHFIGGVTDIAKAAGGAFEAASGAMKIMPILPFPL